MRPPRTMMMKTSTGVGAEPTTLGQPGALDNPKVSRDELMMVEIAGRYRGGAGEGT